MSRIPRTKGKAKVPKYAFAYYPDKLKEVRKPAVNMVLKGLGSPLSSRIDTDPLKAIADACELRKQGDHEVYLVGAVRDLEAPEGLDAKTWKQSIFHVLEDAGIIFKPLDALPKYMTSVTGGSAEIRSYYESRDRLKQELDSRTHSTVMGRPPYGYSISHGALKLNPEYKSAITDVIRGIKDKKAPSEILAHMKTEHSVERDTSSTEDEPAFKTQFWSYQKLRRIFSRLRLYTLGEYTAADGQLHIDRDLAFLPPSWSELTWPKAS
jgi:hypothetical protein